MRREIITWSVVVAVLIGGFLGTVAVLNSTLYSASGFVRGYLDALARHDSAGAMELAGVSSGADTGANVEAGAEASTALLAPDAMGSLDDIRLIDDTEQGGRHRIEFAYIVDGTPGRSSFEIAPAGALLGLFSRWSFTTAPLSSIEITVANDRSFIANGVDLLAPAQDRPHEYAVFTPSSVALSHESTYLEAEQVRVLSEQPGATTPATVDVRPNAEFTTAVQSASVRYFDEVCLPQPVLFPAGCPFGKPIANRTIGPPVWTMTTYPSITLQPASRPGGWRVPSTPGVAHLVVGVQSLFDGSTSTVDEDVPFTVEFVVSFGADGEPTVVPGG